MLSAENYQSLYIPDLDPYTEKTELAEMLGVHRNSVNTWHRLAKILVEDYRKQVRPKQPLSRYQCWVICQIQRLFHLMKRKTLIAQYINKNSYEFSVWSFRQQYKES